MLINLKFLARNETLDNWLINDTPASPPFHETISDQNVPTININADEKLRLHHNVSVSKLRHRGKSIKKYDD